MPDNSSNDLPGSTQTTGWAGLSSRTYGTVSTHSDTDWYRTYLVAGVSYSLTLDADNFDPALTLRDAAGNALKSSTGEASFSRAVVTFTPQTSGYYYLDAHASGNVKGMGDYTLEVTSNQADDYTANNLTTSTLTLGQAGSGSLEVAGDADWHGVVLSAGQTYSIDLGGVLAGNGQIRVMSEGGYTQFVLTTNGHASFTPSRDMLYYIEVAADPNQQVTGSYSVTVTPQPSISISNPSVTEGNDGSTVMSFVITLPSAAASALSLKVDTADETAVAGQDYTAVHTTVTIAAGATTATVSVPILGNTQFTPNRTFTLTAVAAGDTTPHTGRGTIVDDDAPSSLGLPTDPFLGNEWYLYTTRTQQAWALATGAGVKVAVFDAGIDATVSDLAPNLNQALSIDGATLQPGGQPKHPYDFHGTMVASVIAAARNGSGMVGVAYNAQLISIYQGYDGNNTLATLTNGFFYARNADVMNNSWGYDSAFLDDAYSSYFSPVFKVMQDTATLGRGGLGTVIVQSAGNSGDTGDDTNLHNFSNNRYTITVGATDSYGHAAYYSTPGASILLAAPGGGGYEDGNSVFTNDRPGAAGLFPGDTAYLDGTSFAAPVVSGVVALMLQANPHLGLRDVQQILAYSAREIDVGKGSWDSNGARNWNGGGLHYNDSQLVGFGQVDALGAVRLAMSWDGTPQTVTNTYEVDIPRYPTLAIPDNDPNGVSDSITVTDAMTVERVEVYVIITHPFIGDLKLVLTSPTGTQSVLMANPDTSAASPNGAGISGVYFGFSTVLDWGENAKGTWTLKVVDSQAGDVGTLSAWELDIVGQAASSSHTLVYTDEYASMLAADPTRGVLNDPGALDTLNAAALSADSRIDLSGASASMLGGAPLTIAAGTVVVKAISGAGNDTLIANSRGSVLRGMGGNDTLVGGSGTDTAVYGGNLKDYGISISGSAASVADQRANPLDGRDSLSGMERLQFADQHLALDMGASQSGGKAVMMLGAALGTAFTHDLGLASAFIGYFDSGHSLLDGATLLNAIGLLPALAGGSDNASFVRFIYSNVNGSLPDAATLATLVAPLDNHGTTQAQWLADMAASSANQTHVGLVGLAQHGWGYA